MTFRFIRHPAGLAAAVLSLLSGSGAAAQSRLDPKSASMAFDHAGSLCEADQGRAWGVSLCGPMLVADPATRDFIADMDGADTTLERDGEVFKGHLPDSVPIANTAVRWNCRVWTMLLSPLPLCPLPRGAGR